MRYGAVRDFRAHAALCEEPYNKLLYRNYQKRRGYFKARYVGHYLWSEMAVSGRTAVGPEVRLNDVDEQRDNGQDHRGDGGAS